MIRVGSMEPLVGTRRTKLFFFISKSCLEGYAKPTLPVALVNLNGSHFGIFEHSLTFGKHMDALGLVSFSESSHILQQVSQEKKTKISLSNGSISGPLICV